MLLYYIYPYMLTYFDEANKFSICISYLTKHHHLFRRYKFRFGGQDDTKNLRNFYLPSYLGIFFGNYPANFSYPFFCFFHTCIFFFTDKTTLYMMSEFGCIFGAFAHVRIRTLVCEKKKLWLFHRY